MERDYAHEHDMEQLRREQLRADISAEEANEAARAASPFSDWDDWDTLEAEYDLDSED